MSVIVSFLYFRILLSCCTVM